MGPIPKPVSEGGCMSPGQKMCTRKPMFMAPPRSLLARSRGSLLAPLRRDSTPDPRLQTTWLSLLPVRHSIAFEHGAIATTVIHTSGGTVHSFLSQSLPRLHSLAFANNIPFSVDLANLARWTTLVRSHHQSAAT